MNRMRMLGSVALFVAVVSVGSPECGSAAPPEPSAAATPASTATVPPLSDPATTSGAAPMADDVAGKPGDHVFNYTYHDRAFEPWSDEPATAMAAGALTFHVYNQNSKSASSREFAKYLLKEGLGGAVFEGTRRAYVFSNEKILEEAKATNTAKRLLIEKQQVSELSGFLAKNTVPGLIRHESLARRILHSIKSGVFRRAALAVMLVDGGLMIYYLLTDSDDTQPDLLPLTTYVGIPCVLPKGSGEIGCRAETSEQSARDEGGRNGPVLDRLSSAARQAEDALNARH
jgi:hypothetical protein